MGPQQASSHGHLRMEEVQEFPLGFQLGMLPTKQRSMGMKVDQRNHLQGPKARQTEGGIHPILDIHMRTIHTNQGKRIQLVRKDPLHCVMEVESTKHRTVEHRS